MTERESQQRNMFDSMEGLPLGEPNLEDARDADDYLTPEELDRIKHVAEELQMIEEQGSGTLSSSLDMPVEPEPPLPSVQAQESEL